MPKLLFHPGVAHDIKASYEWYEEQASGLGDDFLAEVEEAYAAILEFPRTWPKFSKLCRRYLLGPVNTIEKPSLAAIFSWNKAH